MIIVELAGGLGNQLFQYATGRAVAAQRREVLKLDLGPLRSGTRHYQLGHFNITEQFATDTEIRWVCGPSLTWQEKLAVRIGVRLGLRSMGEWGTPHGVLLREDPRRVDPGQLAGTGPAYLTGYWQSEAYFKDIRRTLLREFSARHALCDQSRRIADEIGRVESVAVHVRRGDYVHDATFRRVHGFCGLDYYERAFAHLKSHLNAPHLFVFSDEPEWTREHLVAPFPARIVDHNTSEEAWEDLCLMAACRHHVIANSSFSWWGAWLATTDSPLVIAPTHWFADKNAPFVVPTPARWTTI